MPRRARLNKRRDTLTLERYLLLTLGPRPFQTLPDGVAWEALEACWVTHRAELIGTDAPERLWGYRVFELGEAPEVELEAVD